MRAAARSLEFNKAGPLPSAEKLVRSRRIADRPANVQDLSVVPGDRKQCLVRAPSSTEEELPHFCLDQVVLRGKAKGPALAASVIAVHLRALFAAGLVVLAVLFKKLVGPEEYRHHFPGWLTFEILAAFLPAAALYRTARHFINWRAFSLTCVSTILISIVWEVTLGLPYKWWGFNNDLMLGIFIDAWWGLPIEEPFLWIMVSFTSIIVFETVKVYLHVRDRHGSRPMPTLFGQPAS